ncbi:MAG: hypothetical protein ACTHU0_01450 [Kofleriaceae bacterium]
MTDRPRPGTDTDRDIRAEIDSLRSSTSAVLEIVRPLSTVPELLRRATDMGQRAEKLDDAIKELSGRIHASDLTHAKLEAAVQTLSARVGDVIASVNTRIDRQEVSLAALAVRVISLETDRVRVKAWAALIGALAGVATVVVGWLLRR